MNHHSFCTACLAGGKLEGGNGNSPSLLNDTVGNLAANSPSPRDHMQMHTDNGNATLADMVELTGGTRRKVGQGAPALGNEGNEAGQHKNNSERNECDSLLQGAQKPKP